jgi:hypothetical protein
MATLRVTSLRGRTAGTSPELPDGAVVTGVTTSTSAIVGSAVTINSTGIDAGAGIITATSFVGTLTGSATTIAGAPNVTLGNVNAGVVTATSYEGSGALLTGLPAGFTELDAALFN